MGKYFGTKLQIVGHKRIKKWIKNALIGASLYISSLYSFPRMFFCIPHVNLIFKSFFYFLGGAMIMNKN